PIDPSPRRDRHISNYLPRAESASDPRVARAVSTRFCQQYQLAVGLVTLMTNYEAPGFAGRFALARKLDRQAHHTWVMALADAARGQHQDVVLDLGAGTGRFWPVLREAWRPRRIVAVDKSPAML